MSVTEAIESSCRALGVGAHLLEVKPVTDIERVVEADTLGDAIDAVTSRAPDRVFRTIDGLLSSDVVEVGALTGTEDLCDGVLVVEHDAGEVAIEAVIEVNHVALLAADGVLDGTAGNDVAGQCEC